LSAPETTPSVAVLVLNWNGARVLGDCLASLSAVTYPRFTIWVVDNASTDDSVAENERRFPNVNWVKLKENKGFAGGNNAGLRALEETIAPPDYVAFLNNDTEVQADFLDPLVRALRQLPEAGAVAPKILYAGSNRIWYGGGQVNLWTGYIGHKRLRAIDTDDIDEAEETDYLTGCCIAMPFPLAKDLGGFDENFSMYGEDVDLSLRLKRAGYRLYYVPQSKIYHKVSASFGHAFSWKKIKRKAKGIFKLYRRWVRWYQWPVLIFSQGVLFLYYLGLLIIMKLKRSSS